MISAPKSITEIAGDVWTYLVLFLSKSKIAPRIPILSNRSQKSKSLQENPIRFYMILAHVCLEGFSKIDSQGGLITVFAIFVVKGVP